MSASAGRRGVERTESDGQVVVSVRVPTGRYVDQFLRLRSAEVLTANRVFLRAKDIGESFAAIAAAMGCGLVDAQDSTVTAVCVGDGRTPRSAATLALRTRWRCHSVDPQLDVDLVRRWPQPIDRLEIHDSRVQSLQARFEGPVILVAVHAHVRLATSVDAIQSRGGDIVAVVSVPCCGYRATELAGFDFVSEHEDWGIWSPERLVQVWGRSRNNEVAH